MLLLFSYLFISVGYVFGVSSKFNINDNDITVDDGVLTSVYTYNSTVTKEFICKHLLVGIDKNAFKNSSEFLYINLDSNKLSNLPQSVFSPVKHLQSLSIRMSQVRDTNFLFNVSATLEILNLDHNSISNVSDSAFANFTHLKKLSLSENKLKNIKFTDSLSPTLTELDLGFNKISELPPGSFRHLNQLTNLVLSFNEITTVAGGAFNGLASIRTLSLSLNEITAIDSETLKGLENTLEELDLGTNKIQRLKKGTFNLTRTSKLDLSYNEISEIEKGSFDMPNLQSLNLYFNLLPTLKRENFTGLPKLNLSSLITNYVQASEGQEQEMIFS